MSRPTRVLFGASAVFCGALLWAETLQLDASPGFAAPSRQPSSSTTSKAASGDAIKSVSPPRAILDTYCVTCHNQRLKTAGLVLEKGAADVDNVGETPALWEKVVLKLRSQAMPPPGARQPGKTEYATLTRSLESALDGAAAGHPTPGRPGAHRL